MAKNRIILYSPSYIIRKGIIHLIHKIQDTPIIEETESIEELNEIVHNSDFDLLFLDSNLFKEKHQFILHLGKDQSDNVIIIQTDKTPKLQRFNNKLNINQNQSQLLDTLTLLLENNLSSEYKNSIPDEISSREADILKYIAMGYSNKEIADKLFLSAHTVVTHRKNITRKLGIKTAPGLTIYAIINKIIDVNDAEKI